MVELTGSRKEGRALVLEGQAGGKARGWDVFELMRDLVKWQRSSATQAFDVTPGSFVGTMKRSYSMCLPVA